MGTGEEFCSGGRWKEVLGGFKYELFLKKK